MNTSIIKKEISIKGGSLTQIINNNISNLKNKKYIIKCKLMDYQKLRLELYDSIGTLKYFLEDYAESTSLKDILKKKIEPYILEDINEFYVLIKKSHDLSKKYKINDLKCIDYECVDFSIDEKKYFENDCDESIYKHFFEFMKHRIINDIDEIKNNLSCSKFYFNSDYKLTDEEFNYTLFLYIAVCASCEVNEREKLGYIIKILLNDYEYKLIRNALNIFYDDEYGYSDYIKGKYKIVETFDENKYDYKTKIVHNEFYPDSFDLEPVEKFEKKNIVSKQCFTLKI